MPPGLKELSTTDITIIVATVVGGLVLLTITIACLCTRRRKLKKRDAQFLNPQLRGGGDEAQEVVEFMKSGSFDSTPPSSSEDSSTQPSELGYTTRSWHEVPRTLQPGVANTALPAYRPAVTYLPKIELADTSIIELPPTQSDQKLKPKALNFSRPSREQFRLNTSRDKLSDETRGTPHKQPTSILKNADTKPDGPNRVSSPTIPTLLQQLKNDHDGSEGRSSSPVSPLTVRTSISTDKDKPRRVSFVSEVSTTKPAAEPKRLSDPS